MPGCGATRIQKRKNTVDARTSDNPAPLSVITIGALLIAIAFRPCGTGSPGALSHKLRLLCHEVGVAI